MRLGGTIHLGGTFEAQQQPPHPHHHITPPAAGWKSPVPYLFGGLAAMLGLIAFALLILACSYWKLSGYLDAGEDSGEATGDEKLKENATATSYQNSLLVIMAGEEKPTFLAMPAVNRATSFGESDDHSDKASCSSGGGDEKEEKVAELETRTTTSTTTPEEEKSGETTT